MVVGPHVLQKMDRVYETKCSRVNVREPLIVEHMQSDNAFVQEGLNFKYGPKNNYNFLRIMVCVRMWLFIAIFIFFDNLQRHLLIIRLLPNNK